MGYMNEKLWDLFVGKVEEEDKNIQKERQCGSEYITAVRTVCEYGIERAGTIRDSFPMFTLHNETHICNVMQLMVNLLGEDSQKLSRDEAAMLIMSACCHDIGMSYSEQEKMEILNDTDRLNEYLDNNHGEYVKAYSKGGDVPIMTDDMIQNYLRCIHHERVMDLLCGIEWPSVLLGKVDRESLIYVCQSHGMEISELDDMEATATVDLRFCAILLRLADILDFDTSRAPEAVYKYSGFQGASDDNAIKSKAEWDKHLASLGFDFLHINERSHMYTLEYNARCKSMQVEQTINCYLDWVDYELICCGKQLKRFAGKWQQFILPGKIKRNIRSEGYLSGQYRLSLAQDKILELFIGKDLYSDPSVFVRELIQNAIDAVRTREQLDKNLPSGWKGQIKIRCWMDEEGYHWFRIEDNGVGMTEEIIINYFLKIGSSYYSSDTFSRSKIKCNADSDYMPISRFGIGILSCFMGDKQTNRVEVSTKHFNEGETYYSALRLSMHGINGYYYLASKNKKHMPGPMKGVTPQEKEQYLKQAGTVIAVRTNLYQTGKYRSFKEIVDRYVIYPPVAIHYDGEEGSYDYPTEMDFMDTVHSIRPSNNLEENGLIEFTISDEDLNSLYNERPEIFFEQSPKLLLKCFSLDYYTSTPYLKGALLTAKVEGEHKPIRLKIGKEEVMADVKIGFWISAKEDSMGIRIYLDFGVSFKEKMSAVDANYSRYNVREKVSGGYSYDKYERGILEAIENGNVFDVEWKKYFTDRYMVSETELNNMIEEMGKLIIKGRDGLKYSIDDVILLKSFHKIKKEWIYKICTLSEYDWYVRYFKRIKNSAGRRSIVAHNGILCGDADFLITEKYNDYNLGTILLLKDKYRPDLDVARDGVRGLSLEIASELEIIKKEIKKKGYNLDGSLSRLNEGNYSYIKMIDFCDLLKEREDLVDQLAFKTNEGVLSIEELGEKLYGKAMLQLQSCPKLSNRSDWTRNGNLYEYLCLAVLRERFSLYIQPTSYSFDILIAKKEKDLQENYKTLFPAAFFLPTVNGETNILTTGSVYDRYSCNEYHRLSQFILKNGAVLNKYVPGIFRELLRLLAEAEKGGLINGVNNLLEHLRRLPGGHFEISETLFLSKKDLL